MSKVEEIEALVQSMVDMNIYPDFITIDGGEGGTGATFQELQDGVGLPLFHGAAYRIWYVRATSN